jgi:PAS domain S-box-containing protein
VRAYLFAALALISALPVCVLGAVQAQRLAQLQVAQSDRTALAAARSLAAQVDASMQSNVAATEAIAAHLATHEELDLAEVRRTLAAHVPHFPNLYGMYVGDAQGRSLAYYPQTETPPGVDYSDRDYFVGILRTRETFISRVQLGKVTQVLNVQVAAPIVPPTDKFIGYALASINLDSIHRQTRLAVDGFSDGRLVVLDSEGQALADSANPSGTNLKSLAHHDVFRNAPTQSVKLARDEHDQRVRAVRVEVSPDLGWHVVAMKPQSAVVAEANRTRIIAGAIALAALGGALALSLLLSGWLSRPLSELAEAASGVATGRLSNLSIPAVDGPRELDQLSAALERMVEVLRQDAQEKERLVAQRTAELSQANADLAVQATAMRHAGDAIEVTDADGHYLFVNPAFEAHTGYRADEVRGRTPWEVFGEGEASKRCHEALRADSTTPLRSGTSIGLRKDGSRFEQEITLARISDADGKLKQIVGVRRDVTELRQAEEALRVSGRLASVGTLAAGVAHEINNPLGYVITNLGFALETLGSYRSELPDSGADVMEALAEAQEGAARVRSIVRDLSTFSRSSEEEGPVNLTHALDLAIKMVANEIRHCARLVLDIDAVRPVHGVGAKLGQVFVNLLTNAVHAIPEGAADSHEIRVSCHEEDEWVIVEISDTGIGMDEQILAQAFDPFFTTKPVGKGTGLGLSICHATIAKMGGELRATSTPSQGTTMRITLPVLEGAELPMQSTAPPDSARVDATLRILVIDDERNVAKSLRRVLNDHRVDLAFGGNEGLELLANNEYDVVLCDLMMPDVSGMALLERVQTRDPETARRFVFMTGGAFTEQAREFVVRQGLTVLAKPIVTPDLRRELAKIAPRTRPAACVGE